MLLYAFVILFNFSIFFNVYIYIVFIDFYSYFFLFVSRFG